MLKPLTHFKWNVRELPPVHCNGSGRANCAEHKRAIIDPALRFLGSKADKEYIRSKCLRNMNFQIVIAIAMRPSAKERYSTRPICNTSQAGLFNRRYRLCYTFDTALLRV